MRRAVPTASNAGRGVVAVGAGVAFVGLAQFVVSATAARALTPSGYSGVVVFLTVVSIVGAGLFGPLEVEVARTIALGAACRASVRRGGMAIVAVTLVLVAGPLGFVATRISDDGAMSARWQVPLLLGGVGILGVLHLTWGGLNGQGESSRTARGLTWMGTAWSVSAVALALVGVDDPRWYCGSFIVAGLSTLWWTSDRQRAGPAAAFAPVRARVLARGVVPLVGVSICSQLIAWGAPLVALLRTGSDGGAAGATMVALLFARPAITVAAPLQSVLVRNHAAAEPSGAEPGPAARPFGWIAGVSVAFVVVAAVAGPSAVPLVFGTRYEVTRSGVTLSAAGGVCFAAALVAASPLLAQGRRRAVAWAWFAGLMAFVVVGALVANPLDASLGGFAAGSVVALGLVTVLRRKVSD